MKIFFAVRYFRENIEYTICEIWGGRGVAHLQLKPGVLVLVLSNCCVWFHFPIYSSPIPCVRNNAYTLNELTAARVGT